ncbi:restriction endonuclease subunit S [Paenibacillus sp. Leaf72]|uniref:restriction endonuclease subunit S n=1 Tax=Paenibacillus sp. Leaf72 TaxID=1736234 RepID=UPI0006F75D3F|nr:restriction endonuclease subunit S [Paenibacillus sp. Leaf72]KQN96205.1 hypothetical protein ASF12_25665 [Paenibacillus sp. Leaf72]
MGKARLDSGIVEINPYSGKKRPAQFYYIDLDAVTAGKLTKDVIVSRTEAPSRAQRLLKVNDILFQTVRPYQQNNYFFSKERELRTVASTGYAQIRTENNPMYIYYSLHQDEFVREVNNRTTGSNYPAINPTELGKCCIYYEPDHKKQDKIAAVLTAADEAIAASRALVEKYAAVKQGLMQDLLSGRVRLSGYKGDWELLKIGNLLDFKNGLNKGKEFFGEGIPIVNYMDVYSKPGIHAASLEGRVRLSKNEIKRFEVRKGDVFFTRTSESVNEVGYTSVLLDDVEDGVFSGFVLRGRPKNDKLDIHYCQFCFTTPEIRRAIIVGATYTTRALTSGTYLSTIPIPLPKPDEQRAIAETIMAADERLTAERERLRKLEDIKRGLMNDLLTNKVTTDKLQGGI